MKLAGENRFQVTSFGRWILSFLYQGLTELRNRAYSHQLLPIQKVKGKVVSVGNLTLGGTGKTPVTQLILQYFVKNNQRVALVSRAYRAKAVAPVEVEPFKPYAAQIYGDEAVMLAKQNPKVRVFVGQHKAEIAKFVAETAGDFDIIVVDDGFQHRALHRDLDLVLVDATEPIKNYRLFPLGRAREKIENLSRAHVLILTKTNLVDEETVGDLQKIVPVDLPTCCLGFELGDIKNPIQDLPEAERFEPPQGEAIYLVAGIAKPGLFMQMFRKKFPDNQFHLIAFNDHHDYSIKDIKLINHRSHQSSWVVTTHKDWVKLKHIWPAAHRIWVADLDVRIDSGQDILYEKLNRCMSI